MADPKPRLKKPVEKVREELLADHDTKRIAKAVGMELEAYVEMVLDYAQNPDKEPMLQVADEAELRAAGYNPPSNEEVAQFFKDGAAGKLGIEGPDFNKSGFDSGKPTPQRDASGPGFESAAGAGGKPSLQGDAGQKQVDVDSSKSDELRGQVNKGGPGRA